jgi:cytochrome P450
VGVNPLVRPLTTVGTFRKVMQPFTFSDGITVSAGETLASPAGAVHLDDSVYERAKEFDGFRFSRAKEMDGERPNAYSVSTGTEFLTFGHGGHAWYKSS